MNGVTTCSEDILELEREQGVTVHEHRRGADPALESGPIHVDNPTDLRDPLPIGMFGYTEDLDLMVNVLVLRRVRGYSGGGLRGLGAKVGLLFPHKEVLVLGWQPHE